MWTVDSGQSAVYCLLATVAVVKQVAILWIGQKRGVFFQLAQPFDGCGNDAIHLLFLFSFPWTRKRAKRGVVPGRQSLPLKDRHRKEKREKSMVLASLDPAVERTGLEKKGKTGLAGGPHLRLTAHNDGWFSKSFARHAMARRTCDCPRTTITMSG
jgi:hypothetical protein